MNGHGTAGPVAHRAPRRDGDTERVVDELERLAAAAVGMTTRILGEHRRHAEMTLPQWRVLVIAGSREDGHAVGEIAARIGASVPSTSRLVRRLERQALVTAARDETDRRVTRVRATPDGLAARNELVDRRQTLIRGAIAGLDLPPTAPLSEGLRVIADAMGRFA